MNWLNLRLVTLRRPEYVGAEPAHRAAWLNVLAYCCEQENGGRIDGARMWKDRQWQQTCGVTLEEVDGASPLLRWDRDDLIIWEYPCDKEAEVQGKREVARVNGASGGRPKTNHEPILETNVKPTLEPTSVADDNQRPKAEGERKEKENKKGNGKEPPPTPAVAASSVVTPEIFMEAWNALPEPFSEVRSMPDDRRTSLRERTRDSFWLENWRQALARMAESKFCRGELDGKWKANVEFFLRPASVAKIMEGNYDDPEPAQKEIWVVQPALDYRAMAKVANEEQLAKERLTWLPEE